ncbi:MAG: hypothetical protein M3Y71_12755 [Actinomycetota bacterium]|nr:hypothetical protein [Actinomycetota bacterium]
MTQDRPAPSDGAGTLVQHGVGRVAPNVVALVVGLGVLAFAVYLRVVDGPLLATWLLLTASAGFVVLGGLVPLLVWHGVQVRIDDSGVLFGSTKRRRRPPNPFGALRQPYATPWGAFANAHVIEGRPAVRAMRKVIAPALLTRRNGFFPRRGATAHLSFLVNPHHVTLPWQRAYTSGTWTIKSHPTPLDPSIIWVFPIRDVDGTIAALQAHGVEVVRDDKPAVPLPWPADALTPPPGA